MTSARSVELFNPSAGSVELFNPELRFELSTTSGSKGLTMGGVPVMRTGAAPISETGSRKVAGRRRQGFASASVALHESVMSAPQAPVSAKVDIKPASDVLAGAMARAASQSTIHPLDTLKVRMQAGDAGKAAMSKFGRLVPPPAGSHAMKQALPQIASLYRGVIGAASGAGIAIGAYFAFYGAASNVLAKNTKLKTGQVAFFAGGIAAAGGSVVKVPLAVCIRSVQAGVYPNVFNACNSITTAAGVRGLFTGYLPTLLEDVPDMAFKFAAYESMRSLRLRLVKGRKATPQEDFCMGAVSGAFAAAATTPLDVIKTRMMCSAAARPTMSSAAAAVWSSGGPSAFFRGIGPRALSNGINSAVFFAFFELLRTTFKQRAAEKAAAAAAAACKGAPVAALSAGTRKRGISRIAFGASRGLGPKTSQAPAGSDGHALQSTA